MSFKKAERRALCFCLLSMLEYDSGSFRTPAQSVSKCRALRLDCVWCSQTIKFTDPYAERTTTNAQFNEYANSVTLIDKLHCQRSASLKCDESISDVGDSRNELVLQLQKSASSFVSTLDGQLFAKNSLDGEAAFA